MSKTIDYSQIPNELNKRIKFIREKKKYIQKDIAEFLNVDRATYAKYESGNRTIPVEAITGLAKFYSLTTDFILGVSAKPEHVDYSNYNTKLSSWATEKLQIISENNNCLYGFNSLLESKHAYRIFHFLGLMLKFPNNYDDLLMDSEDNIPKYGELFAYKEDFTETLNIPRGMFGIEDKDLWYMDDIYVPDVFETFFHTYLTKFINEIRESSDTKKAFFDELKRNYYKDVKDDISGMKEYFEQMEAQDFDNEAE